MWMLTGANGYIIDQTNTKFDAIVFDGEFIMAVGSVVDLRWQYGSVVTRVIDVEGATVIPRLVDNHLLI